MLGMAPEVVPVAVVLLIWPRLLALSHSAACKCLLYMVLALGHSSKVLGYSLLSITAARAE